MNNLKLSYEIAETQFETICRHKAEFIEEVMKHVHCHENDKESIRKLIDISFQEGIDSFMITHLEIMEALKKEGII